MARTAFDDYFDEQMADRARAEAYHQARAEIDACDQFMRALEALRLERGISKAKLAQSSGLPAPSVRKLLTSKSANPTLASVFDLLGSMGYGLKIVPVAAGRARREVRTPVRRAPVAKRAVPRKHPRIAAR
jgi:DNA-binding phage protein